VEGDGGEAGRVEGLVRAAAVDVQGDIRAGPGGLNLRVHVLRSQRVKAFGVPYHQGELRSAHAKMFPGIMSVAWWVESACVLVS
jgi:hypothetical protein